MFQDLQARIQHDIVHTIFHLGVEQNGRQAGGRPGGRSRPGGDNATVMSKVVGNQRREPVAAGGRKVGRNQPCPCGSGKKYKRCHGA